jgi:hypothetical protein
LEKINYSKPKKNSVKEYIENIKSSRICQTLKIDEKTLTEFVK